MAAPICVFIATGRPPLNLPLAKGETKRGYGPATVLFLLASLFSPAPSYAQDDKVKIALLMINADAGIFLALDRGYFKEQGIAVEPIYFSSSGGPQMAALTTGELDAGSGSISPGIYNAVASGVALKVVAAKSRVGPKGSGRFIARSALFEAGKSFSIKDVKGKIVALNSAAGLSRIYLDGFLKKGGLKESDVTIRVMPFSDMAGAMSNGAIDVAFMVQPFGTHVEESGLGVLLADLAELFPGHMTNNLFYSDVFIRNRPRVAEKFMIGFLKGQRLFYDAVAKKKGSLDEVVDVVAKYLRVKDKKLLKLGIGVQELAPNGEVNLKEIQDDQEWYFQHGAIKTKVDVNKMVDLRFLQSAVLALGPYSR
ncbi:MAG TPA: ABC transporter substrate-binding protein [Candidatus Binatia bacterium]